MSALDDLVTAALLGTERRPLHLPAVPAGPLAEALAPLRGRAAEAPAEALLDAAAILFTHERAGRLPPVDVEPLPAPADEHDLPRAGALAEELLASMFGGRYVELLPEWLEAAAKAGRRAPERLLPQLLDWGRTQTEQRGVVRAVMGARGRWLAQQNAAWEYAVGDAVDGTHFETGSRAARLAILRALRDADPGRARELLSSAWRESPAEERAILLGALASNLTPADEPFLEHALDDRAREVRRAAAELLARLSSSRLSERMMARLRGRLALTSGTKRALEISLPESCDAAMTRDGIQPKPPAGVGERAWWMTQMVGLVRPSAFCAHFDRTPVELIEAARRGSWADLLIEGWARGAERHHDEAWADALLRSRTPESTRRLLRLLDAMTDRRREELVLGELLARLEPIRPTSEGPLAMLRYCRHAWSEPFTREVIASLREEERVNRDAFSVLLSLLAQMARWMDPAVARDPAAVGPLPAKGAASRWPELLEAFVPVLQFRLDLRRAFLPGEDGGAPASAPTPASSEPR